MDKKEKSIDELIAEQEKLVKSTRTWTAITLIAATVTFTLFIVSMFN